MISSGDYGIPDCAGAKKAVDECFTNGPEPPTYLSIGQAFALKQPSAEQGKTND
jgi:hypothetical protein